MRENKALTLMAAGKQAWGTMCNLASPLGAETLAHSGYDFIMVDLQHGETGIERVQTMLQAISTTTTTPLVRVVASDPVQIQRALDLGAYGVVVPFINNRAEAEQVVQNACYPPLGSRSWGPTRAMMYAGADYYEGAATGLLILPMIESAEGLRNAAEILDVPGVSGCFVGPADLNISLGGSPAGPFLTETEEGIARIARIARERNLVAGIHAVSVADARKRMSQGFNFVTVTADTRLIRATAEQHLAELRA